MQNTLILFLNQKINKEQKLISKDLNLTYNSHEKDYSPNSLKK